MESQIRSTGCLVGEMLGAGRVALLRSWKISLPKSKQDFQFLGEIHSTQPVPGLPEALCAANFITLPLHLCLDFSSLSFLWSGWKSCLPEDVISALCAERITFGRVQKWSSNHQDLIFISAPCGRIASLLHVQKETPSIGCRNGAHIILFLAPILHPTKVVQLSLAGSSFSQLPETVSSSQPSLPASPLTFWGSWQRRLQMAIEWLQSTWQPVERLPNTQIAITWPWGWGTFYNDQNCFMGHKTPFLRRPS